MSPRSLLIVAVLAAAGLFAMVLSRRTVEQNPVPVVVAPRSTATPAAVAAAPLSTASPQRSVVRTETYFEPVDEAKITAEQAAAAAARYRKAARFPRTSRPLEDGLDPIAKGRIPKVVDADDRHPEPRLLAYPSITNFEAPGDVVIYAEVVELRMAPDRGERNRGAERERLQQFRIGARAVRGVLETMDGVPVSPLAFHDDGTHGDAQPNDDFFTATFTPDPDKPREFRGQYRVLVEADPEKGGELKAQTSFAYSVPIAHLTGKYRDAIVDGNLQIDAEVVVDEAGRFRVESTLVTTKDAKMLGYGYGEAALEPGTHWMPITYYGLIFHDMKAEGPYSMFSTMLSTIGADGSTQESDVVPAAHTTQPYKVSDFGDQPFNDPEYMEKAEHYDAIKRARSDQ